jgi:hypothetical protein
MKKLLSKYFLLIVFISIGMSETLFSQQQKEAKFTVSSGDLLDVSLKQGNIKITTGTGNEVVAVGKNLLDSERELLTMEQKAGMIEIKFKGEDSDRFELELNIPASMNLKLLTGGGNINAVGDLNGTVNASTGGGNISAGNINGKTDFSTAGGNISVGNINNDADLSSAGGDMKAGEINGNADISTAGGNISIGSINKMAEISTAGGNIQVGNVGGKAEISTAGGNIKVGNVSGSADISTGGGNINLESAKGKVDVNTGAGNLNLKNITGSIDANTGAGNIYAELKPEGDVRSDLNSGVGNIMLKVPENTKVNIVASVNVFMWTGDDSDLDNIKSDFTPTTIDKKGEKKQIEVVYQLNGGGPTIELNAAMGEIEIRKLK